MKGRLRLASLEVKEQVLISYARSLAIYFGTPMVAVNIWGKVYIENIEREMYREIHLLPKDINR